MSALYPQVRESARYSCLLTCVAVLHKEQAARCVNTDTALTLKHLDGGEYMAPEAHNAPSDSAQYQDPLIVNARLVNLAADIERRLAIRKALRPQRSDAAKRGWEARK